MDQRTKNSRQSVEGYLADGLRGVRQVFADHEYQLPENILVCHGFTSHGARLDAAGHAVAGETWQPAAANNSRHTMFISTSISSPYEIIEEMVRQAIHTLVPAGSGRGKEYRDVALTIGLKPPMRSAMPGPKLAARLKQISDALGPFPIERLDFASFTRDGGFVADRRKKQKARLLKAECEAPACGYTVRVTAKWLLVGPPHCPKHGPMAAEMPDDDPVVSSPIIDGEFVDLSANASPRKHAFDPAPLQLAAAPALLPAPDGMEGE